ncbi:hypothetical protein, partial [Shigella sp. FC1172]|uniref:hypothetical protein n=1 Tax=Shigella sp. FC1172 TaxID=1890303 RepID=UPI002741BA56
RDPPSVSFVHVPVSLFGLKANLECCSWSSSAMFVQSFAHGRDPPSVSFVHVPVSLFGLKANLECCSWSSSAM